MNSELIACVSCGAGYPGQGTPYICPHCSGVYDWKGELPFRFAGPAQTTNTSIWRWQESFGFEGQVTPISLGEGFTPLIEDCIDQLDIFYKMESMNPTGSYKDRATSVLITFLQSRGVTSAVEDSSGNAGASFAAYAARTGMHARVFVPESASGPKRRQIEAYGTELVTISGPRSAAAQAVIQEVDRGVVYASHAYMPFGLMGIATISYELVEQLGRIPGTVIAPAGHGSLVLGILRGFKAMRSAGVIDDLPTMVTVQSAACDPIRTAWQKEAVAVSEQATVAEGVRVLHPVRLPALLKELDPKHDLVLAYDENCIISACQTLGRRGIDVEPTAALPYCVLMDMGKKLPGPIVLVLTGSGLKYGGLR
ncbi:MAG: pyridoxal-phosphate dependent enzyme [Anaerolineaceae bacterium]|nr:pyridoxal-phosphate dependent enzyme [Anaerolineaceae bacterium]MBN2678347.1 pyridoxal-phosphate dependent enzyme [Anaerolineaceae bacterium]